jgi:hypothetical protein
MARWLRLPTPGTLIALAALVVVSSGSALAATVITSKQIKNGTIQLADMSAAARKALRSAGGPAGARGLPGPAGPQGAQGATGPAGAAGAAGRSALEPLHSGETVRGVWALTGQAGLASTAATGVTLPVPAPSPTDSAHVVVVGNDPTPGDGCSGSAAAPVAAPGFVCIYFATSNATTDAAGYGGLSNTLNVAATGDGNNYGFVIEVGGASGWHANGTWAYTAP